MIYGNKIGGERDQKTYIIEGNGITENLIAVVVDEHEELDATCEDVRVGKKFACKEGIMTGTNDLPFFRFTKGVSEIAPLEEFTFKVDPCDHLDYTILYCMMAPRSNPHKVDNVVIDGIVYNSEGEQISEVTKNESGNTIHLNIINNATEPYLLYFFIGMEG